jgi:hypothetical protein
MKALVVKFYFFIKNRVIQAFQNLRLLVNLTVNLILTHYVSRIINYGYLSSWQVKKIRVTRKNPMLLQF